MRRYGALFVTGLLLAGCGKMDRIKEENEALKMDVGRFQAQNMDLERRLEEERSRLTDRDSSVETARSIQLVLACTVVILGCALAGVLITRKGVRNGDREG